MKMRNSQKLTLAVLVVVLALMIAGLVWTNASRPVFMGQSSGPAAAAQKQPPVDEQPLDTALALAALASTPDEQPFAQAAVRAADHEVDLAFAIALRNASEAAASHNHATSVLSDRLQKAQAEVAAADNRVKQLTAALAQAKPNKKDSLEQRLQLAQAELELDQDQLDDAKEEASRAGGDSQADIQRLWKEHEQSHSGNVTVNVQSGSASGSSLLPASSLIAKWGAWNALRARRAQLRAALTDAHHVSAALSVEHDKLAQQVRSEQPQKRTQAEQAANLLATQKPDGTEPQQAAAAAVSALRRLSSNEKNLSDLVKRIQDVNQLSVTYWRWGRVVGAEAQTALHIILLSLLWITLIVLIAFLINALIDHSLDRLRYDSKRALTLHNVARFAVRIVAGLVILLVIFGPPNNLSTALGLAGAGLTVALKDFLLSFCGWFVLMGRNGIRVGDWVEINGVRGEVAEIGLLRTIIFETGNWTDPGHPTGRQVAFLNSFAVEGYYFNFTTSSQWLWDETQFRIPGGVDPYPIIEKIQAIVQKETESNTQSAEEEWEGIARRYGVKAFSAAPAVNVKSTDQGVDVVVRYITRARERYEVRSRLNHALVDLLHRRKAPAEAASQPVEATPTGSNG